MQLLVVFYLIILNQERQCILHQASTLRPSHQKHHAKRDRHSMEDNTHIARTLIS